MQGCYLPTSQKRFDFLQKEIITYKQKHKRFDSVFFVVVFYYYLFSAKK